MKIRLARDTGETQKRRSFQVYIHFVTPVLPDVWLHKHILPIGSWDRKERAHIPKYCWGKKLIVQMILTLYYYIKLIYIIYMYAYTLNTCKVKTMNNWISRGMVLRPAWPQQLSTWQCLLRQSNICLHRLILRWHDLVWPLGKFLNRFSSVISKKES